MLSIRCIAPMSNEGTTHPLHRPAPIGRPTALRSNGYGSADPRSAGPGGLPLQGLDPQLDRARHPCPVVRAIAPGIVGESAYGRRTLASRFEVGPAARWATRHNQARSLGDGLELADDPHTTLTYGRTSRVGGRGSRSGPTGGPATSRCRPRSGGAHRAVPSQPPSQVVAMPALPARPPGRERRR